MSSSFVRTKIEGKIAHNTWHLINPRLFFSFLLFRNGLFSLSLDGKSLGKYNIGFFFSECLLINELIKGAFVWDQSGIRIIGIMQVSVRLAALPIPEYLDFHSGYSAPRSRIAGIYSRIYSYSRIPDQFRPSALSDRLFKRATLNETICG